MSPLEELRHSASHVLAAALLRLYPQAQLDIGPPTDQGFYYDVDLDTALTAEDLGRIEEEMRAIAKENQRFERIEVSREKAERMLRESGQVRYKPGRLADIPEGEAISFYRNGDFIDLCAGTHVNYTKKLKAFKLLSVAGAYHRGDEKNKQLQRIYGTAFPTKEELQQHLDALEQARQRDHRKLGRELGLFTLSDAVGQGLVLWRPAGAVIRQELEHFISGALRRHGYEQVYTPHIGKLDLFRTSGHFPYYQDSQFHPIVERDELERLSAEGASCADLGERLEAGALDGFLLRPMNCPMHIEIYKAEPRSYRDLPVRLAEFGTVYRWEQSGELNGMTRVRGFTQDDAHIFCTEAQLQAEIAGCLELVQHVFQTLGMDDFAVRVSLRDPASDKYIGAPEAWAKAEAALREAVATLGFNAHEALGEAAFYGPKIDFIVKDVLGRSWQLGTVQVDYNLPERFDLTYTGADNEAHRPVMIHRAPFGSLERFIGVLIEHFGGDFPLWLAPEQVRILPITDAQRAYADEVLAAFRGAGLRAKLDGHADKIGAKIRRAEVAKVPVMVVLGKQEVEARQLTLRSRANKAHEGSHSLEAALELLQADIRNRTLPHKPEG